MEAPMESPSQVDDLVFRASKRRKTNRQRVDSKLDEEPVAHIEQHDEQTSQEPAPLPEESDHEELGLNYVIRARKQQQRRRGGIEFTATRPAFGEEPAKVEAQTRDVAAAVAGNADMSNRFAAQTGYKVQVDSHMMAYIDAELAKRNLASSTTTTRNAINSSDPDPTASSVRGATTSSPAPGSAPHQTPSATTGLIQEVEVAAKSSDANTNKHAKPPRVRLGPDGKPWRSRRPRRTSEDLKRDALVESLLQEHGLNAFDNSEFGSASQGISRGGTDVLAPGANEDADERAAAEFRRQFNEAAEERRTAAHTHMQQKQKNAPAGEAAGGPKLGGSRSQRARMYALELEREKEKKAGKR